MAELTNFTLYAVLLAVICANCVLLLRNIKRPGRVEDTLWEQATQSSLIGVFDWKVGTDSLYWSTEQYNIYGVSKDSFSNNYSAWLDSIHPDHRDETKRRFERALDSTVDKFEGEFRIVRPDSSTRYVRADARIFRDDSGAATRVVGINVDITREVQTERELVQARIDAEAAVRAKSEFVANMSHEIRTPMHAIVAMADLALDEELPEAAREHLNVIAASANHLVAIVDDVLVFSRIDAGKLEIHPAVTDMQQFFRHLESLFRVRAAEKQIRFSVCMENLDGVHLILDEARTRQIITNLLGNAIKFTPPCGQVLVTVKCAALTETKRRLQISIKDSGPGIANEKHAVIFEPFSQADSSTTRMFGGTGLGLTICKQLVDLMRGTIVVESELGHGCEFKLELPAMAARRPQEDMNAQPLRSSFPLEQLPHLKVLVAEDNLVNQKVVRALLKRLGISPTIVDNGEKVVQKLVMGERFDLILMDCQMPVMSGYEATLEVRLLEADLNRRTPILAMTANALTGDRDRCIEAGMDDYISKPIRAHEFAELVYKWAPKSSPVNLTSH